MVQAARVVDPLFLRQSWADNEAWLMKLAADPTPLGRTQLQFFLLNKGPWDRLEHDAPWLPGVPAKPDPGNFYPAGASKDEVSKWIAGLPADQRAAAQSAITTLRRGPGGGFLVVPYSQEYQGELAVAAALLREAAEATTQASLRTFLQKRADALLSNDYVESDMAWMQLDSSIDPTFGPYEQYEDSWFNNKAAFEAFITVVDEKESEKLRKLLRTAPGAGERAADGRQVQESRRSARSLRSGW